MIRLLETFQDVIKLIQTGDRPTLHMVYVGLNKLKLHLEGKDVDSNGDPILIDDRHEGNDYLQKFMRMYASCLFFNRHRFLSTTN